MNHAVSYEAVSGREYSNHPNMRKRAFPELKAVRSDKLRTATRAMIEVERAPGRGMAPAAPISNAQILQRLLLEPINILFIAAPMGIAAEANEYSGAIVFCLCFLGLVPLAKILGDATEHLAENLNETIGGLLNATFGNAVEMIITISAIRSGLLEIVKKSLLGSILSNLLLVLGMSFFVGGLTRSEQQFSGGAALINVTMLFVGIMSFSLPTIFAFGAPPGATLTISRVCAVFVAVGYVAYLVFQLYTHTEFFEDKPPAGLPQEDAVEYVDTDGDRIAFRLNESGKLNFLMNGRLKVSDVTKLEANGRTLFLDGTSAGDWGSARNSTVPAGQEDLTARVMALWARASPDDGDDGEDKAVLGIPWAVALLCVSTVIVAFLSEYMVDAIDGLVTDWGVPQAFVGVILLPIVGNACEHASAIRMAHVNKVATAIAIAIGSSTQIAIFVMPFAVIAGRVFDQPLDLDLHPTGLAVLFLSVLVVFSIVMDGKSNWLEGFMLVLSYCLVAVLYWYTPDHTPE